MQLLPVEIARAAAPRYDADARALYVYIGATEDRQVIQTRSADGILFDCNSADVVVGIEVLVNAAKNILVTSVHMPDLVDDGQYDLRLEDEPELDDVQLYNPSTGTLQVGKDYGSAKAYRLGRHVFLAAAASGSLTIWITGLDGTALA
jgi:uncharacterized protein YuzE